MSGGTGKPRDGMTFLQDVIDTRDQLVYEFDFRKPDAVKWVAKKFGVSRARVRYILENRERYGMPPDFAQPNKREEKANARAVTREWMDNHNLTHLLEEESA